MSADGVVPVSVKRVSSKVDAGEFFVGDIDPFRVVPLVEFAADAKPLTSSGGSDQADDHSETREWLASPVDRDVREHLVLDLVPFARARGEMTNGRDEAGRRGEVLKLGLP